MSAINEGESLLKYVLFQNSFAQKWCRWLFTVLPILICATNLYSQSLTLSQSLTNNNPGTDDPFEFVISVSCNSTTSNCNNAELSGYLPEELDFLSFSDPLPIGVASATYDQATRYYEITFDDGPGNSLAQGSTIQLSLQVVFPGGSLSGISATNTVNATSSNATGATSSITVNLGPDGWQNTPGDFPDWKNGDSDQLQGGYQYWQIEIGNIGFSDIDNYQVFDAIPSVVTLDQLRTPEIPYVNHPGQIYYKRSDDAVNWYLWINFNLINRTTVNVSSLGLPAGVTVSDVRMDLGTVPASPLYNTDRYSDGFNTDLILYGVIDDPLADGVTFTNCADYVGTTLGSPITDQDCITTVINSSIAIDVVSGDLDFAGSTGAYINQANIGDTIKANFVYYSSPEMITDIYGGVMTVVLPPGMSYIPNTLIEEWPCVHFDGYLPVIETGTTIDGREIVRFVYDAALSNEFIIEAVGDWDGCGFYFDVVVTNSALEGNNTGYFYYNATGSTHAECTTPDTENYLNGYAADYCDEDTEDILIVRPPGSAGVRAEKEVIGTLDASYTQYPATGTTVPGGLSNYRITLTNPNATPIDNIEIIDILPYVGDTDILNIATPRFSEWQPNLAAPITPPSGVSVLYTTVNNPCRDELAGSNPTPYPTGCTTPSWSAVPPADITDVTALKFDLFGITLNQNDDITLEFEMRAPVNAPTGGEVSWNSFAYIAENATTSSPLLPTEAIKVGIETIPGTVPIGGDFVWDDLNGNGLQDPGEPGIDGVRVALIEDSNGNGAYNGSDGEYTWTISANGGQYVFSDFPTGNYFIQFSNFPSGYVETHQDVGSNEGLDSDGATTDLIVFNNTTDNREIDFGLFNGTLPPLWSCSSGLLSNEEFESNFTDWTDWGNTSITFDSYVNDRAMLISGGDGGRGQAIAASPGQTFTLSFYAKNTGPETAYGGINFKDVSNNTIYNLQREVFDNTYEYHSITATAPPNTDRIELYGWKNSGAGAAYFDAFCLELLNDMCAAGTDTDGDGIYNQCDIDDDNDGIKDRDENICRGDERQLVWWSHNTPSNTTNADILSPSLIASGTQETYGVGLGAYLESTLLKMSGVDQVDLSGAMTDNDYVQYSFTTQSNIDALYISHFAFNKHGTVSLGAPEHYGFDFSVFVSDDGFTTSQLISDVFTIDPNINPSWVTMTQEADDNYYYLRPNTTYTFRVYFYNKTSNTGDAWFDDFEVRGELCDIPLDTDGDTYVNSLDLDSDNDGIYDVIEAGHNGLDADNDGIIDGSDANSGRNGLDDGVESTADVGTYNYTLSDSESSSDGIYDPYELDSDGDGCYDTEEENVYDPENDGIAGSSIPVVNSVGLVSANVYQDPPNNLWQQPTIGFCLPEDCTNGVDDDADGLVDCADPDCGVTTIEYYNYQKAYAVVGQDDFVTRTSGTAPNKFNSVRDVLIDPQSNKVFVAEGSNNRVLRYASYDDFLNNRDAEAALGQPNLVSNTAGTSQTMMDNPNGLAIATNGDLFVTEYYNNRVLKFSNAATIPTGSPADVVFGQPDFTTNSNARTQTKMFRPYEMIIEDDNTLWVADGWNGRVLRFDNATTLGNGPPADGVLGQTNYTSHVVTVDAVHIDQATGLAMVEGILFVGDYQANRVLIWDNAKNAPNGAPANRVLGQPDFTTDTAPIDARYVGGISDLDIDPSHNLFVQDIWQDRTTIFFDAPNVQTYEAAEVVLHQPDFTTILGGVNVTQRKSSNPNGLRYTRQGYVNYLVEGEQGGHRVLITRPAIETDEITSVTDTLPGRDLSGQNSANFQIVTQPTDGTVTLDNASTGQFTYVPPGLCPINVDTSFTFLYSITNVYGCVDTAEMLIFVDDVGPCYDISGSIFEDINYGGGSGRDYTTSDASAQGSGWAADDIAIANVRIELYDNTGAFVTSTITDANGLYNFNDLVPATYSVRAVNNSISSNRGSNSTGQPIIPSQTYRHTGAVSVINEVGGFNPILIDANPNTTNSNISTLYTATTTVQSLSIVTLGSADASGVDFGFNFDVIVNENDSGQGSLRQFILNSNELTNTNLDQEDFPPTGENFTKPSGTEHSIFMIGGVGVHRITPLSELPAISDTYTHITGYTQEGSSQGSISARTNTIELHGNTTSFDGLIINANYTTISGLVINEFRTGINGNSTRNNLFIWGNYIGTSTNGLSGLGNSSAGINLQNFTNSFIGTNGDNSNDANEGNLVSDNSQGIQIRNGSGFLIAGNIVGLNSAGSTAIGNTFNGIYIRDATGSNVIGYDDTATSNVVANFRNVSSSNGNDGVRLFNASNQIIAGNYLGTDITGTIGRGNGNYGVQLSGDDDSNIIGTDSDGIDDSSERNIISGNGTGIRLASTGNGAGNRISGNYIGTNNTGNVALGNLNNGIEINDLFINTIIGTNGDNVRDAIERNVISGNVEDGIRLDGTTGNIIAGNYIGVGANGSTAVGNGKRGVLIATNASNNIVGYDASMANSDELEVGNYIKNNDDSGVAISGTGTQNRISRNQLADNSGLGIDLDYDLVTSNDNGDGDTGPNNLYNFPMISSVLLLNNNLTITGFAPSGSSIEFYIADAGPNPSPLPVGYTRSFGEGRLYLFTVNEGSAQDSNGTTGVYNNDGTGVIFNRTQNRFSFTIDVSSISVSEGDFLSATATDSNDNTSEFSNIIEVILNCGTATTNPHIRYNRAALRR